MTSAPARDTRFRLSEGLASQLAAEFGTPLYVVDEQTFRERIREYRAAFRAAYADSELTYASKANSTVALLAIAASEGCQIDAASEGELRAALAAGVPAAHCHLHGNNKSRAELEFAIRQGIGQIIVDNFGEIETIAELTATWETKTPLIIRLAPGVDPVTHEKISTGQSDTKFGFNISDGSAERAVVKCLDLGLNLVGFHCHVGSQLLDPEAQLTGGEFIARFAADMYDRLCFRSQYLNVGGGLGVRYIDGDRPTPVEDYCRLVVKGVLRGLAGAGKSGAQAPQSKELPLRPILAQEPGRSLIGEAGVTLYRVGVVKTVPSGPGKTRTYVGVDGGLSDNPRPALYGARYAVERVAPTTDAEPRRVTVSGRHCESDKLFEGVDLPADLAAGDLLEVLCTGAYNSSMASNYNRFPRPGTVLIRSDGTPMLVQKRETWDEMLAREILPEDLRQRGL